MGYSFENIIKAFEPHCKKTGLAFAKYNDFYAVFAYDPVCDRFTWYDKPIRTPEEMLEYLLNDYETIYAQEHGIDDPEHMTDDIMKSIKEEIDKILQSID